MLMVAMYMIWQVVWINGSHQIVITARDDSGNLTP